MENELLRAESGANIKAYLDYVDVKRRNALPFTEDCKYWNDIYFSCKKELELRINQIFPR